MTNSCILYKYYNISKIIAKHNNKIKETEEVKQNGILYTLYLFNYFINDFLIQCLVLQVRFKNQR